MKKVLCIIGYSLLVISIAGCISLWHPKKKIVKAQILPSYSGPKARVTVSDFDIKAARATPEVGSTMREMLVAALTNSNRFSVVERKELNAPVQEEGQVGVQSLEAGNFKKSKTKPADLIIAASIIEFEPQASGGRAGIGGGGGQANGILGGLLGAGPNKAHIVLNISIFDASTQKALSTSRTQGQAADVTNGFMAGIFGDSNPGNGLSIYSRTPMEKAMRICIVEGARFIIQAVPEKYYKH